MAQTENSAGEEGVPSNSQSTYTTPNSLAARDIIESNKASVIEFFVTLVNNFLLITNVARASALDVAGALDPPPLLIHTHKNKVGNK